MLKERATLKKVTDLEDCADMFVAIAKNTSMTGQRVAVGTYHRIFPTVLMTFIN